MQNTSNSCCSFFLAIHCLVGMLLSVSAVFGQTNGLVTQIGRGPTGRNVVQLVNSAAVIARSYVVDCLYDVAGGEEATYTVTHVSFGGPPFAVAAGGQQTLPCPPTTKESYVRAVVYEDGTPVGSQPYLGNLILARQQQLPEVLAVLNVVHAAATSSLPVDGNWLAAQIFQLVASPSSSGTTSSDSHPALWVGGVLQSNRRQPLGTYVSRLMTLLNTYSSVVQSSIGR